MKKNAQPSKTPLNKCQAGFTLMELVVAALLVSGAIAGLFSALVNANVFIQPQANISRNIARMHMERFREAVRGDWWGDPDSLALVNNGTPGMPLTLPSTFGQDISLGTVAADGLTYTVTYKVTRMHIPGSPPVGAGGDYRRVQVDVTW